MSISCLVSLKAHIWLIGGWCFEEFMSGHGLCGGRVASWSSQLPVKLGGSLLGRLSGSSFCGLKI